MSQPTPQEKGGKFFYNDAKFHHSHSKTGTSDLAFLLASKKLAKECNINKDLWFFITDGNKSKLILRKTRYLR